MRSGPICRQCGSVVPTVSWVTMVLEGSEPDDSEPEEPAETVEADRDVAGGTGGAVDPAPPAGGRAWEVGLCPDCLSRAKAEGRVLAPVIPIGSGRSTRRRRAAD